MHKACQVQKIALYSTTPHPLPLVFSAPLFQQSLLSLSGGGFTIDDPFRTQRLFSLILKSIYTHTFTGQWHLMYNIIICEHWCFYLNFNFLYVLGFIVDL